MIQFNSWVGYIILILFSGLISVVSSLGYFLTTSSGNGIGKSGGGSFTPSWFFLTFNLSNVSLPEIKTIANQRYLYLNSLGKIYLKHLGEESK
jgi:hypothetical protein